MHSHTLKNPTEPSTEAPLPAPAAELREADLADLLPGPDDGLLSLPEMIRGVVTDVAAASGASPACVAATTLAIIAAALGPNARFPRPSCPISPVFNVVVSHNAPRTLSWFDLLVAPFIAKTLEMQVAASGVGVERIKREVEQFRKQYTAAAQTACGDSGLISWLKGEIGRGDARIKPWIASSRIAYQEVARLMPLSFDGGIVLIGLGNDPGDDFTRLKAPERSRIAELLNRSWSGFPLSLNGKTYAGALSILWQTARPVGEIIGRPGFDPKFLSVPMLVFEEHGNSAHLPALPHEAVWKRINEILLENRYSAAGTAFTIEPEAEAALDAFEKELHQNLRAAGEHRRHVVWLPELARRIALVFQVLAQEEGSCITAAAAENAVVVTKWVGRQHLRSVAFTPLVFGSAAKADSTDKAAAMYRKICTKAPVSHRDLWRSYDSPKAEWFTPVLETLISSGKVLRDEQNHLVPAE